MTDPLPGDHADARRREDASIRMEQKFQDFLESNRIDKDESIKWRKEIEDKVKILDRLDTPVRLIVGIFVLMVTPILGVVGWDIGKIILRWLDRVIK